MLNTFYDTCGLSYIWLYQNVNCLRNILLNTVAVNLQNQIQTTVEIRHLRIFEMLNL